MGNKLNLALYIMGAVTANLLMVPLFKKEKEPFISYIFPLIMWTLFSWVTVLLYIWHEVLFPGKPKILEDETKKPPSRLYVAFRAFWSILREKKHAFADEETRSVIGDYHDMQVFHSNIHDLYKTGVEKKDWMNKVEKMLKGEI